MRILLTTDTIGGVWTFTKELSVELLYQGHEVALISFGRMPSEAQRAWAEEVTTYGSGRFVSVASEIPLEWMQANDLVYDPALSVILDVADRFVPDILHTSQFCFGSLPSCLPTLITAHSDVVSWAAACHADALEASAWLSRYRRLVQDGLDAARCVVAPTRWMLDALRTGFKVPSPTQVIFNGRSLSPTSIDTPRKLQAVSVGRLWDKAKNLDLLAEVKCSMPLLVAGEDGDENSFADSSGLCLLGRLEEVEVTNLFRESSVYIVPSTYEPFGLAALEAAQCGCAIMANDIPSLREVWGEGATYFRSADQLSHALDRLVSSEDGRKSAQIAAQTRARELTATRMTEQYLELYRQILAVPAPRLVYVQ